MADEVPCAIGCGRSFARGDRSVKITKHGAVPEWAPWSVIGLDEDTGERVEYARVRCWLCDDIYYPRDWMVEQIKAESSDE
jgi:hypothetical protein